MSNYFKASAIMSLESILFILLLLGPLKQSLQILVDKKYYLSVLHLSTKN